MLYIIYVYTYYTHNLDDFLDLNFLDDSDTQ